MRQLCNEWMAVTPTKRWSLNEGRVRVRVCVCADSYGDSLVMYQSLEFFQIDETLFWTS